MNLKSIRVALMLPAKVIILVLLLTMILTYIFSMVLGIMLFYFTSNGRSFSNQYMQGIPIEVFMVVGFYAPIHMGVGVVFGTLWTIYVICFLAGERLRIPIHRAIVDYLRSPSALPYKNWLLTMPVAANMLLVAVLALQSFQESQGVQTGSISFPDPFTALFSLAYSPILEEISYRVTPIGTLLLIYVFWRGKAYVKTAKAVNVLKLAVFSYLYPEKAKRTVGIRTVHGYGIRGITLAEWGIITVTSMAFGVAHFTSGAGWGPGKITSALLAGLMFAIVYLAYGVEAPILLHWFFNYYWEAYGLAFQTYSEIAGTLSPLIEMQLVFFGYVTWFFLFAVAAWKLVGRLLALVKSKASTASVRDNRTN